MKPKWLQFQIGEVHGMFAPAAILAAASQEDVFKSIESNVGGPVDIGKVLALVLAALAATMLLVWTSRRRKARVAPRAVNNSAQLVKEVAKAIGMKPAEIKRIKQMAQQGREKLGLPIENPLVLMLCPSLLGKVMKTKK